MIWSYFLRFSAPDEPVWIPGQRCRPPAHEQWPVHPSRASKEPYQILQGKRGLAGLLQLPDMAVHCPEHLFPSSFGSQSPWDTWVRQLLLCKTSIFLPLLSFKQSYYHCPDLTAGEDKGGAHAAYENPSRHTQPLHSSPGSRDSKEHMKQAAPKATRLHSWSTFGKVCGFFGKIKKKKTIPVQQSPS